MKDNVSQYYQFIYDALRTRYDIRRDKSGKEFFVFKNGASGILSSSEKRGSLWMEYADDIATGEKGLFPWDSESYYIEDMTREEMRDMIILNIETMKTYNRQLAEGYRD